jgi:GNAT superfamily N-acetyltransferase
MIPAQNCIATSQPGLGLRPARPDDESLMFRLYVSSKELEFGAMPLPQHQKEFLLRQQHLAQMATWRDQYPNMQEWIIELNGEPIGRLFFSVAPDEIMVQDLALLPDHRNGGVGAIVIRDVIFAEAARTGIVARASVTPYNPARRLYARLGVVELPPTGDSPLIPIEWRPPAVS